MNVKYTKSKNDLAVGYKPANKYSETLKTRHGWTNLKKIWWALEFYGYVCFLRLALHGSVLNSCN